LKKLSLFLGPAILALLFSFTFLSCGGGKKNSPASTAVTGVSLNKASAGLAVGGMEALTATVAPANATNKAVTWSSSNASVATVSGSGADGLNGLVTAIAPGTATITATTVDGNKTATCTVTVSTIIAAGYEVGADSKSHAMLWTDGAAKQLSGNPSNAYSVFVSGSDVYVAGSEEGSDGKPRATLWKNGAAQRLSDLESKAASVSVSGNDVYVAGYEAVPGYSLYAPTLWKNGTAEHVTAAANIYSYTPLPTYVFVSGSDVYVGCTLAGYSHIWTNGVKMELNPSGYATINSLYASGNTLYCAGWGIGFGTRAVIFKVVGSDVTPQYLDAGASAANSVFVSGSNVYAAGYTGSPLPGMTEESRRAKVWKDGAAQALSDSRSEASSVFVSGGDVYVGGHEFVGNDAGDQRARVWKNGTAQNLSNRQSGVASVYVVK